MPETTDIDQLIKQYGGTVKTKTAAQPAQDIDALISKYGGSYQEMSPVPAMEAAPKPSAQPFYPGLGESLWQGAEDVWWMGKRVGENLLGFAGQVGKQLWSPLEGMREEAEKAGTAYAEGQVPDVIRHGIASMIPVAGPVLSQMAESTVSEQEAMWEKGKALVKKGDYPDAAMHFGASFVPIAGPMMARILDAAASERTPESRKELMEAIADPLTLWLMGKVGPNIKGPSARLAMRNLRIGSNRILRALDPRGPLYKQLDNALPHIYDYADKSGRVWDSFGAFANSAMGAANEFYQKNYERFAAPIRARVQRISGQPIGQALAKSQSLLTEIESPGYVKKVLDQARAFSQGTLSFEQLETLRSNLNAAVERYYAEHGLHNRSLLRANPKMSKYLSGLEAIRDTIDYTVDTLGNLRPGTTRGVLRTYSDLKSVADLAEERVQELEQSKRVGPSTSKAASLGMEAARFVSYGHHLLAGARTMNEIAKWSKTADGLIQNARRRFDAGTRLQAKPLLGRAAGKRAMARPLGISQRPPSAQTTGGRLLPPGSPPPGQMMLPPGPAGPKLLPPGASRITNLPQFGGNPSEYYTGPKPEGGNVQVEVTPYFKDMPTIEEPRVRGVGPRDTTLGPKDVIDEGVPDTGPSADLNKMMEEGQKAKAEKPRRDMSVDELTQSYLDEWGEMGTFSRVSGSYSNEIEADGTVGKITGRYRDVSSGVELDEIEGLRDLRASKADIEKALRTRKGKLYRRARGKAKRKARKMNRIYENAKRFGVEDEYLEYPEMIDALLTADEGKIEAAVRGAFNEIANEYGDSWENPMKEMSPLPEPLEDPVAKFNREAAEAYESEQESRVNELAKQGISGKANVPTEEVRGPLFGNEIKAPEQSTMFGESLPDDIIPTDKEFMGAKMYHLRLPDGTPDTFMVPPGADVLVEAEKIRQKNIHRYPGK